MGVPWLGRGRRPGSFAGIIGSVVVLPWIEVWFP